jgi:hypothetical protein
MAHRWLAGLVQLVIFLAGFFCTIGWFIQRSVATYRLINDLPEQSPRFPWLGMWGLGLAVAGWILSWFTSLNLLREARLNEVSSTPSKLDVPPKLSGPPKLSP